MQGGVEDKQISFTITPQKGSRGSVGTPTMTPSRVLLANAERNFIMLTPEQKEQMSVADIETGKIVQTYKFEKVRVSMVAHSSTQRLSTWPARRLPLPGLSGSQRMVLSLYVCYVCARTCVCVRRTVVRSPCLTSTTTTRPRRWRFAAPFLAWTTTDCAGEGRTRTHADMIY